MTPFHPMATFSGFKRVPLIAISYNGLAPRLSLEDGAAVIRVVRRHVLPLAGLERVTTTKGIGRMVTLVPRAGWRSFSANFAYDEARRFLAALRDAGAPLDEAAHALLAQRGAAKA